MRGGSKGHGDRGGKRGQIEEKLHIEIALNGKPHNILFNISTVSREGKLRRKAATVTLREKNQRERGGGKQELEETLPASLPPCLKLSDSAVCAEGIPLWQSMDLSLTPLSASQSCYY